MEWYWWIIAAGIVDLVLCTLLLRFWPPKSREEQEADDEAQIEWLKQRRMMKGQP